MGNHSRLFVYGISLGGFIGFVLWIALNYHN